MNYFHAYIIKFKQRVKQHVLVVEGASTVTAKLSIETFLTSNKLVVYEFLTAHGTFWTNIGIWVLICGSITPKVSNENHHAVATSKIKLFYLP